MGNDSYIRNDSNEAVADLTPSAKLVFKTLQHDGEYTQKELAEQTHLSQRTIRNAIRTLEENDVIVSLINFRDTRQHVYLTASRSQSDDSQR